MNPALLFSIANTVALATWIVLVVAPGSRAAEVLVHRGVTPLILALGYWGCAVGFVASGPAEGWGFGSLDAVRTLFTSEWALLGGWIHYLAFDLLIGGDVDRRLRGKRPPLRVVCLALTFLLGPIGWSLSLLAGRGVSRA
jgi:hypothetical protein